MKLRIDGRRYVGASGLGAEWMVIAATFSRNRFLAYAVNIHRRN
jgi:hypothetical protein